MRLLLALLLLTGCAPYRFAGPEEEPEEEEIEQKTEYCVAERAVAKVGGEGHRAPERCDAP